MDLVNCCVAVCLPKQYVGGKECSKLVGNWCDYGPSLTAACSSVPAEAVCRWEGMLKLVGNWCDYGPSLTAACSSVPA